MYTCARCSKIFKIKGDIRRHLNRKFPCEDIGSGKKCLECDTDINCAKCENSHFLKEISLGSNERDISIHS